MAMGAAKRGSPGPSTVKKSHRTRSKKKKLRVNERVEVRSEEAGFLGSWHQGIVMASGHRRRCVKFDHILVEDGSESVIEHVEVPPAVDGIDSSELHLDYRGSIRPLPPDIATGPWDLPYGACVEVYHLEAWWEGVVFDHNDGAGERTVFFPDQGDELVAALSSIRATVTWNEVTESWRRRGPWLFLEVIEEFEKEWPLPVSVKQTWYDLRERDDFDKIKEWTSNDKPVWEVLIRETISENLMVALKDVLPHLANSINITTCLTDAPKMDCGPRVESVGEEGGFTGSGPAKLTGPTAITETPEKDEDNGPSKCSHKEPSPENLQQPLAGTAESPRFSSQEMPSPEMGSKSKSRERLKWQPAVPDLVPGGVASPDAIARYTAGKGIKHCESLTACVRKHLVHLGWKIDFTFSDQLLRFRYISPAGKSYFSLVKVCKHIAGTSNNEETQSGFTGAVSMQPEDISQSFQDMPHRGINPDMPVLKNVYSAKPLKTASVHKKRKRETMPSLNGRSDTSLGSASKVDGVAIN